MGRGINLAHSVELISRSPGSIWKVHLDYGPAPPPEDGPPFSAHASRDKSQLPWQLIAIFAAYLAIVIVLGTLLFTIGRRSRKKAMDLSVRPTELVQASARMFDASPISPGSSNVWYSPKRLRNKISTPRSLRSGKSNGPTSPGADSQASFDPEVVEADKRKRQDDMGRLYAAVMEEDERRFSREQSPAPSFAEQSPTPTRMQQRRPPRLMTENLRINTLQQEASALSPHTPKGPHTPKTPVRAIYPPESPLAGSLSGRSPIAPTHPEPLSPRLVGRPSIDSQRIGVAQPMPPPSSKPSGSRKKLRQSLSQLKISSPFRSHHEDDSGRTPLSPPAWTSTEPGSAQVPTTAGTTSSHAGEAEDQLGELPHTPLRTSMQRPPQFVVGSPSPPPKQEKAAGSASRPLPLRQLAAEHSQARRTTVGGPSLFTTGENPYSAGPMRTTFLESKKDRITALRSANLPTGVGTPYSPYMPFSPVTPVTPHLTTRFERRQRQREARRMQAATTAEDAVADEKELWGSSY
ncbi:hypothetical protein K470DRAFT_258280 [Piedraia hortae CBS 480.64]|uniref:Uncharacterized protein n=1 Tax=Piedraia hortae CBS 480.64 TaxID=1314780 RepID=A0A6A7C051_9PEZI|nr:hypothetical protein K470DRAFT_258280 [Piedraia hortae CBS 480.64]